MTNPDSEQGFVFLKTTNAGIYVASGTFLKIAC